MSAMLEEKSLACAERLHSAVDELYAFLFETSPITVDRYGQRIQTLTPEAWFVAAKARDVENALQKYSTELDRLYPVLIGIHQDILARVA
jgi:hypothetical protein